MRPRPSSAGGTAATASVAFLMMLVSACEISRRSKRAGIGSSAISTSISMSALPTRCRNTTWRTVSATSSADMTGLGMRAKRENSSTMRLMSSTWRTMVSVHCLKTPASSWITAAYLRRSRSAESWIGRERILDLVGDAAGDVGPGRGALRAHQLGDVVERHHVAVLGGAGLLAGDADRQVALAAAAVDGDLALHQALQAGERGGDHAGELRHDLGQRPSERLGLGAGDQPLGRAVHDADAALARRRR